MILLDLFTFLGRLHPMAVHLPIGFLLLAAVFDGLSYLKRYRYLRPAVGIALFAGFIAAVLACIFGYLLSLSGDYPRESLSNHRLAGIVLAVTSGVLWFVTTPTFKLHLFVPTKSASILTVVVIILLFYTGHQGGSLTHGPDYISMEILQITKRAKPGKAEEAFIFEDVVQPLLDKHCSGCHREGKRKGGLLLNSWDNVIKGGKNGAVVVSSDIGKSELYRRITLDPSDDDFMPTDGKKPLTKLETQIIRWWIEHGIPHNRQLVEFKDNARIIPVVATVLNLPEATLILENDVADMHPANPAIPLQVDLKLVDNLRNKGVIVKLISHHPVMLDITLPPNAVASIGDIETDLRALSKNVIWLNLSDNDLKDEDINILKEFANMERLRLDKNPVTDAVGDVVVDLKFLEALNMSRTKLTDTGLIKLRQHSSLKRIYTWNSLTKAEN